MFSRFVKSSILAVLVIALAAHAQAQTSAVAIVPEPQAAGSTAPVPIAPLTVPDVEYPFDALLAGEEGSVELSLVVNIEGHPVASRMTKSSGVAELDQAALNVAASRWLFHPATREGQPAAGSVTIHIDWKLPLERVDDYQLSAPPPPTGVTPPRPIAMTSKDPAFGLDLGIVGIRYLVQQDGKVGEVEIAQSSGVETLDRTAVEAAKGTWKFAPATIGGKPVDIWRTGVIAYDGRIRGDGTSAAQDKSDMRCYERPVNAQTFLSVTPNVDFGFLGPVLLPSGRYQITRWVLVSSSGEVTDALVRLAGGLYRPSPALLGIMKEGTGYKKGANCWYYDPVVFTRPVVKSITDSAPTPGTLVRDEAVCSRFSQPPDAKLAACDELLGPYGPRVRRGHNYEMRAMAYAQIGDRESAARDYAASVREYENYYRDSWQSFNDRCWAHAVANIDLEVGLSECDESLRLRGSFGINIDSRGLIYLRLGQFEKAIADYSAALKSNPNLAGSLYGRGIARLRMGDAKGGNADIKAAEMAERTVAVRFATYGVTP